MDPNVIRYNERYRALGTFCDNAALAIFAASVAQAFVKDGSGLLVVIGVLLGFTGWFSGWQIRVLIQSEGAE